MILSQNCQMNHFFSQPISLLAMGYVSAGTPGTLIRAPKQQYLPSEQTRFLELLCERVQLGPWGLPSEPPNKNIYPQKKLVFLGPFLKEERPVILSQNCQMNIYFLNPPHFWLGAMYWPAGTPGIPIRSPDQHSTLFIPGTSPFSLAAFREGKDHLFSLKTAK